MRFFIATIVVLAALTVAYADPFCGMPSRYGGCIVDCIKNGDGPNYFQCKPICFARLGGKSGRAADEEADRPCATDSYGNCIVKCIQLDMGTRYNQCQDICLEDLANNVETIMKIATEGA